MDIGDVDDYTECRVPLIIGCILVTLLTIVNGKDLVKLWPHPAFWKAIWGLQLCYSAFMTVVLILPLD